MDERFRNILNLALHPSTGEGEAQAALNRARAMVAKTSLDALLGSSSAPQERVVTKERVVYRDPSYKHHMGIKFRIGQRWMHSFLERLFGDAAHYGCMVEMISCNGQNRSSASGMELEVEIHGSRDGLKRFDREIDRWMTVMRGEEPNESGQEQAKPRGRASNAYSPPPPPPPPPPRQEQSAGKKWWQKLADFGRQG